MLADDTRESSFTEFVEVFESKLRQALIAAFGVDIGCDAAADALAYGWEHWDSIADMDRPDGYLYRVGYNRARRMRRRNSALPAVDTDRLPWVEPALPDAFASLPERQRVVVALLYGYEWSLSEVATYLGISKGTVQTHAERGMAKLRRKLRVE